MDLPIQKGVKMAELIFLTIGIGYLVKVMYDKHLKKNTDDQPETKKDVK